MFLAHESLSIQHLDRFSRFAGFGVAGLPDRSRHVRHACRQAGSIGHTMRAMRPKSLKENLPLYCWRRGVVVSGVRQ